MNGTMGTRGRALLSLALLAACGEQPDFQVGRVGVIVRSDAAFAHRPDLPNRIAHTVAAALEYWGGTWDDLAGVDIVLEGSRHVHCGHATGASGCFDGEIRVSTRDAAFVYSCVEQTTLVHEIGHAIIGDTEHLDRRWLDFGAVQEALQGQSGYGPDGRREPCVLYPTVWRHPPGNGR